MAKRGGKKNHAPKECVGSVFCINPRYAKVVEAKSNIEIWIKKRDWNYAIHGDKVSVQNIIYSHKKNRYEGKIEKILKRNNDEIVGRIEIFKQYAFAVPENKNILTDIHIYPENLGKSKNNDIVVVKIVKWHDKNVRSPLGVVKKILGKTGNNEAEMQAIMAYYHLPFQFPKTIQKDAQNLNTAITKKEIQKRKDFRPVTTFTIDPDDAQDFDDALSIRKIAEANWEIGIHIADVTHYVKQNSALDKEALDRGTSVYLVDRTIPMLPEILSNQLCSLRPHEDKLTFSIVFTINEEGVITNQWIGKTIIHSDKRLTYQEAQKHIESNVDKLSPYLQVVNAIAQKLKKRRIQNGAINFESNELKFIFNESGHLKSIEPKERQEAHFLIEEFMLMANKKIAEYVHKKIAKSQSKQRAFVYRTHDRPDTEKLANFGMFVKKYGYTFPQAGHQVVQNMNALFEKMENKNEKNILEKMAIRSMAKAIYTTDPKPHFGLGFQHYTHFTSPIRRYPDIMVHRLVSQFLKEEGTHSLDTDLQSQCDHATDKEKKAVEAERASIKYYQVAFMQNFVGSTFEGIVSGITEWGIYVTLIQTHCEGMIRKADLDDDDYIFFPNLMKMEGRWSQKSIEIGDFLTVQVVNADLQRRTIDLLRLPSEKK